MALYLTRTPRCNTTNNFQGRPTMADPIVAMETGTEFIFYFYDGDEQPQSRSAFVFYAPDETEPSTGAKGAFFWCDAGKKERSSARRLYVIDITDLCLNASTKIFENFLDQGLEPELCFSMVSDLDVDNLLDEPESDYTEWNLQAKDTSTAQTWLIGIQEAIHNLGMGIERANPEEALGLTIEDDTMSVASASLISTDSSKPHLPQVGVAHSALAQNPLFSMLRAGIEVMLYEKIGQGITRTQKHFFFEPTKQNSIGRFHWCDTGTRLISLESSLGTDEITDIFLGKRTDVMTSQAAKIAPDDCCLSILGTGYAGRRVVLNIETGNPGLLNSLVEAISVICQEHGLDVVASDQDEDEPLDQTDSNLGRTRTGSKARAFSVNEVNTEAAATSPTSTPSLDTISQMLAKGHNFFIYEVNPRNQQVERREVLLWFVQTHHLEKGETFNGCFYWSLPGDQQASQGRSLLLSEITDIFMGKQTDTFNSIAAQFAEESRCFSLLRADGFTVDIEAPSVTVLTAWLLAFNTLLSEQGQQIMKQEDASPTASMVSSLHPPAPSSVLEKRRYSIIPDGAARATANFTPTVIVPPVAETLDMMAQGSAFTLFDPDAKDIWLQLEKVHANTSLEDGSLHMALKWWEKDGDSSNAKLLLLDDITDIFLGDQTHVLKSVVEEFGADPRRLLAIVAEGNYRELNLEAGSVETLTAWVHGLSEALGGGGAIVLADQLAKSTNQQSMSQTKSMLPKFSIEHSLSRKYDTASELSLDHDDTIKFLANGRVFNKWNVTNGVPVCERKIIFYHAPCWICWTNTLDLAMDPTQRASLHDVIDVLLGKVSKTFQLAIDAIEKRCFSLVLRSGRSAEVTYLNLEAETDEQATAWLQGIQILLASIGKSVTQQPLQPQSGSTSRQRFSVVLSSAAHHMDSMKRSNRLPPDLMTDPALQALADGVTFRAYHYGQDGPTQSDLFVFLMLDETSCGSLYWCEPGFRVADPTHRLMWTDVTDIHVGKRTPVFHELIAVHAEERLCFSIIGSSSALHLEAFDLSSRDSFFRGLSRLIEATDTAVVEKVDGQERGSPTSRASSTTPVSRKLSLNHYEHPRFVPRHPSETMKAVLRRQSLIFRPNAEVVQMMNRGHIFTLYRAEPYPAGSAEACLVFYRQIDGPGTAGSLQWCDVPNEGHLVSTDQFRNVFPENTLALQELQQVFLGKVSRAFMTSKARKADASCCISFRWKDRTLDLEASSPEQLSSWLFGINTILDRCGRTVNETPSLLPVADLSSAKDEVNGNGARSTAYHKLQQSLPGDSENSGDDRSLSSLGPRHLAFTKTNKLRSKMPFSANKIEEEGWNSPDAQDHINFVCTGVPMCIYIMRSGKIRRAKVLLWYAPGSHPKVPGSLFWGPPRDGPLPDPARVIHLADVSDIFLGKVTSVFRSPLASTALESRCFSLLTKTNTEFSFEADTAHDLNRFIFGLNTVLSAGGMRVVQRMNSTPTTSSDPLPATKPSRRFTILADQFVTPDFPFQDYFGTSGPRETMSAIAAGGDHVQYFMENNPGTLELLQRGSIFTGYAENRRGEFLKKILLVFYNPNHDPPYGTLYWCDPSTEQRPESRHCCLPLRDITDIYMGQHTDVFESGVARGAIPDHCFSLLSRKTNRTIDLEAKNVETLNAWLLAINGIMMKSGRKVQHGDEGEATNVIAGPVDNQKASADRKLQSLSREHEKKVGGYIIPAASPRIPQDSVKSFAGKETLVTHSQVQIFRMLTAGRVFWRYSENGREPVLVFYGKASSRTGRLGSLFWGDPQDGSENLERMIQLHRISKIFIGKETPNFRSVHADQADPRKCASFVDKAGRALDVEAESVEQLAAWLFGINYILQHSGRKVTLKNNTGNTPLSAGTADTDGSLREFSLADENVDTSIECTNLGFRTSPISVALKLGNQPGSVLGLSDADLINVMMEGREFTMYFDLGERIARSDVFLRLVRAKGSDLGNLYWSSPSSKGERSPGNRLQVRQLTGVWVGKVAPEFIRFQVSDQTCFSLITKRKSLHLEARSADAAATWLMGISSLLQGSKIIKAENEAETDSDFVDSGHRFQILNQVPGSQPRSVPRSRPGQSPSPGVSSGSRPKQSDSSGDSFETGLPTDLKPYIEDMLHGGKFLSYFFKGASVLSEEQFYFYDPKGGRNGSGFIYWCPLGERTKNPKNGFPISSIKEIYNKKRTPELVKGAKDADDAHCFSILAKRGKSMHVVAPSRKVVRAWQIGIRKLLEHAGKKVTSASKGSVATPSPAKNPSRTPAAPPSSSKPVARSLLRTLAGEAHAMIKEPSRSPLMFFRAVETLQTAVLATRFSVHAGEESIYVWLDPTEGTYGSIRCCNQLQPHAKRSLTLPLETLKEMFHGKFAQQLQGLQAHKILGNCCLSLTSSSPEALHIAFSSPQVCQIWVSCINHILTSHGMKVYLQEFESSSDACVRERFTILQPGESLSRETKGASQVNPMRHGEWFTRYVRRIGGNVSTQSILLYYAAEDHTRLGSLYWRHENVRTTDPMDCIPIHTLSDIYHGPHHPEFSGLPTNRRANCLSLKSDNGKSLHLEADSQGKLSNWIDGLVYILRQSGRRVSSQHQMQGRRISVVFPDPGDEVRVMMAGSTFTRYVQNGKQTVTVWYSLDTSAAFGTLFWCTGHARGQPSAEPDQCMHLHDVVDIIEGKQGENFVKEWAHDAVDSRCLILVGKHSRLDLEALDDHTFEVWVRGIQSTMARSGRPLVLEEQDPITNKRRLSIAAYQPVIGQAELDAQQDRGSNRRTLFEVCTAETLARLTVGQELTGYFVDQQSGGVREQVVRVRYNSSQECLSISNSHTNGAARMGFDPYPLLLTKEIYFGQSASNLKDQAVRQSVDPTLVFSLIAEDGAEITLSAVDQETFREWVLGLSIILSQAGLNPCAVENGPAPKRFSIRPRISSENSDTRELTLISLASFQEQQLIQMLVAGETFQGYFEGASGEGTIGMPCYVFYRPGLPDKTESQAGSSLGTLFWAAEAGYEDKRTCIPLDDLVTVVHGKLSDVFQV